MDGLTKQQRYNLKRPVLSFRVGIDVKNDLMELFESNDTSLQSVYERLTKNLLKENGYKVKLPETGKL